jgi:hypothetical protein
MEMYIAGVSVIGLVMALTEKVKSVAPDLNSELVSMVLGALFAALGYLHTSGVPATLQEIIVAIIFVCVGIVGPSGIYDVIKQ